MNGQKRVLVIEDDKSQCRPLVKLLQHRGIVAECAVSLAKGREMLEEMARSGHRFSLVVCDLILPDSLDPFKTLEATDGFGTPILPWTGAEDPLLIREFRRRDMRFVLKGSRTEGVLKAILEAIEWHEPSPEIERALIQTGKDMRRRSFSDTWKRIGVNAAVVATILGVAGTVGAASIGAYRWIKETGKAEVVDTQAIERLSTRISAEQTARESAVNEERKTRSEADAALAQTLKDIQVEQAKIVQAQGEAMQRDIRSEDERKFLQQQMAETNKRMDAGWAELRKTMERFEDKLDRINERR